MNYQKLLVDLQKEREAIDRAILAITPLAGQKPKRGRPTNAERALRMSLQGAGKTNPAKGGGGQ